MSDSVIWLQGSIYHNEARTLGRHPSASILLPPQRDGSLFSKPSRMYAHALKQPVTRELLTFRAILQPSLFSTAHLDTTSTSIPQAATFTLLRCIETTRSAVKQAWSVKSISCHQKTTANPRPAMLLSHSLGEFELPCPPGALWKVLLVVKGQSVFVAAPCLFSFVSVSRREGGPPRLRRWPLHQR